MGTPLGQNLGTPQPFQTQHPAQVETPKTGQTSPPTLTKINQFKEVHQALSDEMLQDLKEISMELDKVQEQSVHTNILNELPNQASVGEKVSNEPHTKPAGEPKVDDKTLHNNEPLNSIPPAVGAKKDIPETKPGLLARIFIGLENIGKELATITGLRALSKGISNAFNKRGTDYTPLWYTGSAEFQKKDSTKDILNEKAQNLTKKMGLNSTNWKEEGAFVEDWEKPTDTNKVDKEVKGGDKGNEAKKPSFMDRLFNRGVKEKDENPYIGENALDGLKQILGPEAALTSVLNIYQDKYKPKTNENNLRDYVKSDDFVRHAASAQVYFNKDELSEGDAQRVITQREPTNLNSQQLYDKAKLKEQLGYEGSVFNEGAVKANGEKFSDRPNTAAVYSETYLWDPPGGDNKKEVAILSLPAPPLDSPKQPHFNYFVQDGKLNRQRYDQEMAKLFQMAEKCVMNNKEKAFNGQGINRIVLTKLGQEAFLNHLRFNSPGEVKVANDIFKERMNEFVNKLRNNGVEIEVVMSEFQAPPKGEEWHQPYIVGDIINSSQSRDLILNPWDPHSAAGNGTEGDKSLDGALGKSSGVMPTQTTWLNDNLKNSSNYIGV